MVIPRKINFFEMESRTYEWKLPGDRFWFHYKRETWEPLGGGELLVALEVTKQRLADLLVEDLPGSLRMLQMGCLAPEGHFGKALFSTRSQKPLPSPLWVIPSFGRIWNPAGIVVLEAAARAGGSCR